MSKLDPFSNLPVDVSPLAAPRVPDKAKLPKFLRRNYTVEFQILDRALKGVSGKEPAVKLDLATRSAASSLRFQLYRARMAHRETTRDTVDELKYERIYMVIKDTTLELYLLPDLLALL